MSAEVARTDGPYATICVAATRSDTVGATIAAVRRQTFTGWELLIVAQGDPDRLDPAIERAREGDPRIRFFHIAGRGLSRARNAALERAAGSIVAFTDDDCEPNDDWLNVIVKEFRSDPSLGAVGGSVLAPAALAPLTTCPTLSPSEALYDPANTPGRPPAGWDWIGANFALRRSVVELIGPFDECLGAGAEFPAAEDTDYKLRLEAARIRMLATPRAAVVHTYGVRRGLAAVLRSQRSYATGNGAMAAKQTLLGDPRGTLWRRQTRRDAIDLMRPMATVRGLRRLYHFEAAYRRCVAAYEIAGGRLRRRAGSATSAERPAAGHAPIEAGRLRP